MIQSKSIVLRLALDLLASMAVEHLADLDIDDGGQRRSAETTIVVQQKEARKPTNETTQTSH